jgi:hypothetical protein
MEISCNFLSYTKQRTLRWKGGKHGGAAPGFRAALPSAGWIEKLDY